MTTHTPSPPGVDEPYVQPDTQAGAFTNCECVDCREKRLADTRDQIYTPHDMADAYTAGWRDGFVSGAAVGRRLP